MCGILFFFVFSLQNKTSSAVQLKHLPTGLVVKSQATRSRAQNRQIARRLLAEKLEELEKGSAARTHVKAAAQRKRKASAAKKARRKYRRLAEEAQGADEDGDGKRRKGDDRRGGGGNDDLVDDDDDDDDGDDVPEVEDGRPDKGR
jgi:protein subunit release factor B